MHCPSASRIYIGLSFCFCIGYFKLMLLDSATLYTYAVFSRSQFAHMYSVLCTHAHAYFSINYAQARVAGPFEYLDSRIGLHIVRCLPSNAAATADAKTPIRCECR